MSDAFPLLSVVILADSQHHFLHQTLESLSCQEEQNFEVLLLDARDSWEWIHYKSLFRLDLCKMEGKTAGAAMNQALNLCRGLYIQFLRPGERFLSHQATAYIAQLASENRCPEILYGAQGSYFPSPFNQAGNRPHKPSRSLVSQERTHFPRRV